MDNPNLEELNKKYSGKLFRYKSKYGGFVDNIVCDRISATERYQFDSETGKVHIIYYELYIISDKNNIYEFDNINFYE